MSTSLHHKQHLLVLRHLIGRHLTRNDDEMHLMIASGIAEIAHFDTEAKSNQIEDDSRSKCRKKSHPSPFWRQNTKYLNIADVKEYCINRMACTGNQISPIIFRPITHTSAYSPTPAKPGVFGSLNGERILWPLDTWCRSLPQLSADNDWFQIQFYFGKQKVLCHWHDHLCYPVS